MIRKEKDIHIRVSHDFDQYIKDKAQRSGISSSKLIRIAVELVTESDVLEYMVIKSGIAKKQR